jgi:hypothetical protein
MAFLFVLAFPLTSGEPRNKPSLTLCELLTGSSFAARSLPCNQGKDSTCRYRSSLLRCRISIQPMSQMGHSRRREPIWSYCPLPLRSEHGLEAEPTTSGLCVRRDGARSTGLHAKLACSRASSSPGFPGGHVQRYGSPRYLKSQVDIGHPCSVIWECGGMAGGRAGAANFDASGRLYRYAPPDHRTGRLRAICQGFERNRLRRSS